VIGGVANPKQISSRSQITLSRAVWSAGGATKNADQKKITIFRREAGETKIIEADLEKIKGGEAEDLILRALDIVDVGQTGRTRSKFPPVLRVAETGGKNTATLPLRIID
jgi:protein involved in polysaccharide export with SLBB domain